VVDLRDNGGRVVVGSTRKRENVRNKKIGMSSSRAPKDEGLLFFKGLSKNSTRVRFFALQPSQV
jgi:hypothetical protein